MNRSRITALSLGMLILALCVGTAGAAGPVIKWQVFSSAGAAASNGTITLNSSFGQTAVGVATTLTDRASYGYWYFKGGLGIERRHVYLPFVGNNFKP
jgi:hypothetical protein